MTLFNLGTPTLRSLASSLEMNPEPQAVLSSSSKDQRMKYIAEYSHQESHGATTAQPVLFFRSVEEKNTGLYVRHLIPYVYTLFPGSASICPRASLCILCCDFLYSCVDLMRLRNTRFTNTLELSVITVSPLCTLVTFTVAMEERREEERREGWREEEKDGRKEGREETGLFWLTV